MSSLSTLQKLQLAHDSSEISSLNKLRQVVVKQPSNLFFPQQLKTKYLDTEESKKKRNNQKIGNIDQKVRNRVVRTSGMSIRLPEHNEEPIIVNPELIVRNTAGQQEIREEAEKKREEAKEHEDRVFEQHNRELDLEEEERDNAVTYPHRTLSILDKIDANKLREPIMRIEY